MTIFALMVAVVEGALGYPSYFLTIVGLAWRWPLVGAIAIGMARAALEAMAHQTRDLANAYAADGAEWTGWFHLDISIG